MGAFQISMGDGPIVAAAIHDGHDLRPEIQRLIALTEVERLREEDPHTGRWARLADSTIVGKRSRFELDLNRPREKAIYRNPEDAWGLTVWREPLDPATVARSLTIYDEFFRVVQRAIDRLLTVYPRIVVLDLHSYNQYREDRENEDREGHSGSTQSGKHPDINIGTGTMARRYWRVLVEEMTNDLRAFDFLGRRLDVQENVRFQGGYFGRWLHTKFPRRVCARHRSQEVLYGRMDRRRRPKTNRCRRKVDRIDVSGASPSARCDESTSRRLPTIDGPSTLSRVVRKSSGSRGKPTKSRHRK